MVHLLAKTIETIDLASAWYEATHLPFLFAVFVANKSIERDQLYSLQNQLDKALHWSDTHREKVEREAQKLSQLPLELIREYYTLCRYRLSKKDLESLTLFNKLRDVSKVCS